VGCYLCSGQAVRISVLRIVFIVLSEELVSNLLIVNIYTSYIFIKFTTFSKLNRLNHVLYLGVNFTPSFIWVVDAFDEGIILLLSSKNLMYTVGLNHVFAFKKKPLMTYKLFLLHTS